MMRFGKRISFKRWWEKNQRIWIKIFKILKFQVIVTIKSSGCLQIGLGSISSIIFLTICPPTLVNKIYKVLNCSQVCLFRSQVCPYKLQILAGFIANFNVFSFIRTPCEVNRRFKTLKGDVAPK